MVNCLCFVSVVPFLVLFTYVSAVEMAPNLPTLYEYYTENGIKSGLSDKQEYFTLNNKNITIYSGALHYFRVPQEYWIDRLRKYRAAGLNTVETYVPWNLHEPEIGVFDFGNGGTDFEHFLDIKKFIELAKSEDLLVIVRPGPYICAEWEFGGLPSWLLRENLKIRTSDEKFIKHVERYFKQLLKILQPLQFTKGGPIIAFQIENEYGNTKKENEDVDTKYLYTLENILRENYIEELLFTSDTPSNGFYGTLPHILATANFMEEPEKELKLLKKYQPNRPLMVMEYWSGWFDHWTEKHHTTTPEKFATVLEETFKLNSSVNFYMFHGGTNWGFMNGGNIKGFESTDNGGYQPDTTSYDYDAPLSENGDYTEKYYKAKDLIQKYNSVKTIVPKIPELQERVAYNAIEITGELSLNDIENSCPVIQNHKKTISMELLPINNNNGQSYGYIVYKKDNLNIPANTILKIEGRVCDTVLVLINGVLRSPILKTKKDLDNFGFWTTKDSSLDLGNENYENATLDLVVENWGRSNYGKLNQFNQHKGLWQGNILLNNDVLTDWKIIPLEFKKKMLTGLSKWNKPTFSNGPYLYKGVLNVDEPKDTYVDMRDWNMGFIVVNGFVLARYCKLGPQQTAYLPAPLLKKGQNDIFIFEHFTPAKQIKFCKDPIFENL